MRLRLRRGRRRTWSGVDRAETHRAADLLGNDCMSAREAAHGTLNLLVTLMSEPVATKPRRNEKP